MELQARLKPGPTLEFDRDAVRSGDLVLSLPLLNLGKGSEGDSTGSTTGETREHVKSPLFPPEDLVLEPTLLAMTIGECLDDDAVALNASARIDAGVFFPNKDRVDGGDARTGA